MSTVGWWLAGVGLVAFIVGLQALRRSTRQLAATPYGIVAFEFAGTVEMSQTILDHWGPQGQRAARANLLADLPLLAGYSLLAAGLSLGLSPGVANNTWPFVWQVGLIAAILGMVAGLCDLTEDLILLTVLEDAAHGREPVARHIRWARTCAIVKFGSLGVVAGWTTLFLLPSAITSGCATG